MPADALPYRPDPGGTVTDPPGRSPFRFRRTYIDVLNRPMRGRVTFTTVDGLPVPVTVDLVDGVLEVELPAGAYRATAQLRTADGDRLIRSSLVLIPAEPNA